MKWVKVSLIKPEPFEKRELYVRRVMRKYRISRATAFRFIRQGYALIREYPKALPEGMDALQIAKRSAHYVLRKIYYAKDRPDLVKECTQSALVAIFLNADQIGTDVNKAYRSGYVGALDALKWWLLHADDAPLDERAIYDDLVDDGDIPPETED